MSIIVTYGRFEEETGQTVVLLASLLASSSSGGLDSVCDPFVCPLLHFPPLCCNSTSSLSQKTTFISDKELDPSGGNIMYAIEQQSSGDF